MYNKNQISLELIWIFYFLFSRSFNASIFQFISPILANTGFILFNLDDNTMLICM